VHYGNIAQGHEQEVAISLGEAMCYMEYFFWYYIFQGKKIVHYVCYEKQSTVWHFHLVWLHTINLDIV